jgi:hypothetical protein
MVSNWMPMSFSQFVDRPFWSHRWLRLCTTAAKPDTELGLMLFWLDRDDNERTGGGHPTTGWLLFLQAAITIASVGVDWSDLEIFHMETLVHLEQ